MMSQMGLGGMGGAGGMGGLGGLDPSALKGMDMSKLQDLARRFK
jgi:signal recognition particle subunit SRP54